MNVIKNIEYFTFNGERFFGQIVIDDNNYFEGLVVEDLSLDLSDILIFGNLSDDCITIYKINNQEEMDVLCGIRDENKYDVNLYYVKDSRFVHISNGSVIIKNISNELDKHEFQYEVNATKEKISYEMMQKCLNCKIK